MPRTQARRRPWEGGVPVLPHRRPPPRPTALVPLRHPHHHKGPGLDLTRTITIREPPYQGSNKITDWALNCGYHYYLWGPYHFADCDCMVGRTGEVHGKISFRWEFTADPPDGLLVTASEDSLRFKPQTPYSSYAQRAGGIQ